MPAQSAGVVYLAGVLYVSSRLGLWPGLATCAVSALAFNFFFLPPRYTFVISSSGDWLTLALYAVTAVVTSGLAWLQSESQERAAREIVLASRALAAGEDGQLVTGSVDPALVAVAAAFSAAARRVDADRRASSERYRALFDGAGDAILLVDPSSGCIVEASARAERLFAEVQKVFGENLQEKSAGGGQRADRQHGLRDPAESEQGRGQAEQGDG